MDCQLSLNKSKHYQSQLHCDPQPTKYTQFFVWGQNDFGQVGFRIQNDQESSDVITTPKLLTYNIMVKSVACGQFHTHILSQSGFVYSMGSNKDGRLGLGLTYQQLQKSTSPRLIETIQQIKSIECGDSHTLAVDKSFRVYGWGVADAGQLGLRQTRVNAPMHVDVQGQAIKEVACGSQHSAFLTVEGQVYTCGSNNQGQLGMSNKQLMESEPEMVRLSNSNDKVKQVACGGHHTMLLMETGLVYTCGLNSNGQLGIGHTSNVTTPQLVQSIAQQQVRKVSAGTNSSYALTYNGELYVMGQFNQKSHIYPEKLDINKQMIDIKCRYEAVAAVDTDNKVWIWSNQSNNLRIPFQPQLSEQLSQQKVSKVFLGQNLVFAVSQDPNQDLLKPKKSVKKLALSGSKSGLRKLKKTNSHARNTFDKRSASVAGTHQTISSHRGSKNLQKQTIVSQLYSNISISPISQRRSTLKTPCEQRPPSAPRNKSKSASKRQSIHAAPSHLYNYKTQLSVKKLQSSERQTIQDEDEYQDDDIIRQLNMSQCTSYATPKPQPTFNQEVQSLKAQLESERLRNSDLEKQIKLLREQHQPYQQDMDQKIGELGQQMEELFKSYQDQSSEIMTYKEKYQQSMDQNSKLKDQLVKIEELLIEKEEELSKYQSLGSKLLETEQNIDKIIEEKDQREEELLNKMSTLADHYHKEKEKNGKLISEMQRLNETLERLDHHIRLLQSEKSKAHEVVEHLQDELARGKVECNKDSYNLFINKIPVNDGHSQITQSTDRSQLVTQQPDDSCKASLKDNIGSQDNLSKLLKGYHLYQKPVEQIQKISDNEFKRHKVIEKQESSFDSLVQNRVNNFNREDSSKKREDYSDYVLRNLEKKAQKASAEKRGYSNERSLEAVRYKTTLSKLPDSPKPQSLYSPTAAAPVTFDLNDTCSSILLQEVPIDRPAFKEISHNDTICMTEEDHKPKQPRDFSSSKKALASMVDNEMREVSAMMSQLQNFNMKREELQNRVKKMPNNLVSI